MWSGSVFDPLLAALARAHAQRQFDRFMRATRSAAQVQERVLLARLRRNAGSLFGRKHGFSRIGSYRDFASQVPVQTYEDLRPYVERVMAGETQALFRRGQRVLMFAMTSGSTDKPKYVPVTPEFLSEYRRGWNVFGVKALLDHPGAFPRSILQVVSPVEEHRIESGIPCGSISGLLAATQKRLVRKYYVCPAATGRIADPDARYYTIMRLGLPRDVSWMITASPATQVHLARTAAKHTERLIRDIRDGTMQAPGEVPDIVYQAVACELQPDRNAARRLTVLAEKHGELLPKHCWRLALMSNWTGGTLGLHLQHFPHYFGSTPVRDIGLLATEGRVSIPLADGAAAGVLDVTGSFFEFVDAEANANDKTAIRRCHELTLGREYRVIMTTSAGFYRYDIGDHVRARDYLGRAPIIEFLHRGAYVSSMTGEKLTEWQVAAAFGRACRALGLSVLDFLVVPVWADPPFYRLHLDVEAGDPGRLTVLLDEELSRLNMEYASKRSSGRLGSIVMNRLPPGTLARLDAARLRRGGAANEQYKPQCLYTKPGDDQALLAVGTVHPGVAAGENGGAR